jgi:hypothetical protein
VVINVNINQNIDTAKKCKYYFERFIDMGYILRIAGKLRVPQQMTVVENNTEITQIAKELKITPILDKLLEYKRNWI